MSLQRSKEFEGSDAFGLSHHNNSSQNSKGGLRSEQSDPVKQLSEKGFGNHQ